MWKSVEHKQPQKEGSTHSVFGIHHDILSSEQLQQLRQWLDTNKNYQSSDSNDLMKVPRTQIWYQKDNHYFCPDWKGRFDRWKSFDYDSFLSLLQDKIQSISSTLITEWNSSNPDKQIESPIINSCLVNRYNNGRDSIKPHRDSVNSFGATPTIVGLSVGQTRTIVLEPVSRKDPNNSRFSFSLPSNSLFIMAGASQEKYLHSIPKIQHDSSLMHRDQVRYSLTFREWCGNNKKLS